MSLIDCLLMVLLNTVVCICLPRLLTLLQPSFTHFTLDLSGNGSDRIASKARPDFSKSTTYSELNPIVPQSQTSSSAV